MPKSASITTRSPISPASMRRLTSMIAGMNHVHMASIRNRPCCRAASTISRAWAALSANAFSHNTCLPAASAATVISWWLLWGEAT